MERNTRRTEIIKWIFIVMMSIVIVSYVASLTFNNVDISMENKIAVISIEGVIGQDLGSDGVNAKNIVSYIEAADQDDSIKGIILDINSPGGSVLPSEIIATAIKNSKKPTVAVINDVGASGAYWIASAANKIVAYPMSITGSIGVRGSYLEFSGLMEKYGVTYVDVNAGEYKDLGSPYKSVSEKEREVLLGTTQKIYDYFVNQVSINRGLDKKTVENLANGYIYLGYEAKENGLIDELGDENTAINIIKQSANITDAKLVYYKEKRTIFDILNQISSNSFYFLGEGIGSKLFNLKEKTNFETIM